MQLKQAEHEFYVEKESLEATLESYKTRLEEALASAQTTGVAPADALREKDETIAQLEERVIETDSKLVMLKVRFLKHALE